MINILANYNPLSFGVVSYYTTKELFRLNNNIAVFPKNNFDLSAYVDQDNECFRQMIENSKFFDCNAPTLNIYHQFALAESIGKGKRIGWSFFELDILKPQEVHHINSLDHFIVSSNWAKSVCEECGVKIPISIVYPGVLDVGCKMKDRSDIVKFLVCGKFEKRKLHLEIAEAFSEAFDLFDNVHLDMATYNPFCSKEETEKWVNSIKSTKLGHKINFIDPMQLHTDILKVYSNYDVFIGLSRAEGFFLPLLEAMSAGCLCIASNNTAMGDYVTKDNSILVESCGKIKAEDGKWFFGDGNWNDFNQDDIIEALREAQECSHIAKREKAIETARYFNWEKTAKAIMRIKSYVT